MRRLFIYLACGTAAIACSSTTEKQSDLDGSGGSAGNLATGGSAGAGGSANQAGTGGSSGASGAMGGSESGGQGAGGSSGTSVSGGNGGTGTGGTDAGTGGTGTGGSGASGGSSGCAPEAGTRCEGDDLYTVDSCGALGELAETCCAGCRFGSCAAPTPVCQDGDIHATENCVDPTEKLQECGPGACVNGQCECEFASIALESWVRDQINLPTGSITSADTVNLFDLILPGGQNFSNLSGVECLTQLKTARFVNTSTTDYSPLLALNELWQVHVNSIPLDAGALASLGQLTRLTSLFVNLCDVSDLAWLSGFTQLQTLLVGNNLITDISPLANHTTLEELGLNSNTISDLSPIANLSSLRTLDLCNNNISDLSPLRGLTNLKTLYVCDNPITDVTPLLDLPPLTALVASGIDVDCQGDAAVVEQIRTRHPGADICY